MLKYKLQKYLTTLLATLNIHVDLSIEEGIHEDIVVYMVFIQQIFIVKIRIINSKLYYCNGDNWNMLTKLIFTSVIINRLQEIMND